MNEEFSRAVTFVIDVLEGGDKLVTADADPAGGLTRWGISSRSHPELDVENLTREEAEKIYQEEYWDECECDKFPWPMDLVIFDTAVNQGTAYANQLAFSALDYVEALMLRVERYADLVKKKPALLHNFHGWIDRLVTIFKRVQA